MLDLLERNLDLREFDAMDGGYHHLYLGILELFPRDEVRDERRWALIEDEKGDIRLHRGEAERALQHYATALAYFQAAKDAPRITDLAWKRGLALQQLGKVADARAAADEGLRVARAAGVATERLEQLRAELKR